MEMSWFTLIMSTSLLSEDALLSLATKGAAETGRGDLEALFEKYEEPLDLTSSINCWATYRCLSRCYATAV